MDFAAIEVVLAAGPADRRAPADVASHRPEDLRGPRPRRTRQGVIHARSGRGAGRPAPRGGHSVDTAAYDARNRGAAEAADELYAFRMNRSAGMGDAIARVRAVGVPATVRADLAWVQGRHGGSAGTASRGGAGDRPD